MNRTWGARRRVWGAQRTAQEALTALAWPADRTAEAVAALAVVGGLQPAPGSPRPQSATGVGESLERQLERAAEHAGVDLDPVSLTDEPAPPVLLAVGPPDAPALLAVARWNGRRALVVPPEGGAQQVQAESVLAALVPKPDYERQARLEALLEVAGAKTRRHRTALATLGVPRSGAAARAWALRPSPGAAFLGQARRAGLVALAIGFVAAHAIQFTLWLASWWVLGRAVLVGTPSAAELGAWAGILAAVIPVRLLADWLQGRLALGAGRLLRRRLLAGALAQDPDQIRHQGTWRHVR